MIVAFAILAIYNPRQRKVKKDSFWILTTISKGEKQSLFLHLVALSDVWIWARASQQGKQYCYKKCLYVMVITYDLLPIVDRKLKDQQQLYDFTIYDLETLRYR